MQVCDFSRSFLSFRIDFEQQPAVTYSHDPSHTLNNARIQIDCLCTLSPPGEASVLYALGAPCKTERVNVTGDIWTQPNAEFQLVASDEQFLVIKHYDHCGRRVMLHPPSLGEQPHRQSGRVAETFASLKIDLHQAGGVLLKSVDDIINATLENRPLVAVTEFVTDDGIDVRLVYPVKTMNVGEREMFYQTDTGPLLFPVNPSGCDPVIECFQLAYIAFNSPNWAEVLLDVPVAVSEDVTVRHYAKPLRIECRNTLAALGTRSTD